MTGDSGLLQTVRTAIYSTAATTGHVPNAEDVAKRLELEVGDVERAFAALADAHVVVLHPGSSTVCWAPPFSGVPTSFRVHAGRIAWYAPCAWDSFGIPAALKRDVTIRARCAWSGEPLPCAVTDGRVTGTGVIHLEVPARHFWDDIFYT